MYPFFYPFIYWWHLGCFQHLAIVNYAAMYIGVLLFWKLTLYNFLMNCKLQLMSSPNKMLPQMTQMSFIVLFKDSRTTNLLTSSLIRMTLLWKSCIFSLLQLSTVKYFLLTNISFYWPMIFKDHFYISIALIVSTLGLLRLLTWHTKNIHQVEIYFRQNKISFYVY